MAAAGWDRESIMASNARWRWIFAALAIVAPLGLFALFGAQEGRLRALAAHGRVATATLAAITRQDTDTYVEYRYEVDGQPYTWSVSQAQAPYALGETFPITYLPEDPSFSEPGREYSLARLDTDLHRRLQRGLEVGSFAFFAAAAALCERGLRRMRTGTPLRTVPQVNPATLGHVLAGILLAATLGARLDPKVAAVDAAVFGAAPLGLPLSLVVTVASIVLFAPLFPVMSHLMQIVMGWHSRGGSLSRAGIVVAVFRADPAHHRSRAIVLGGFVYFAALLAAWIALTASRGV